MELMEDSLRTQPGTHVDGAVGPSLFEVLIVLVRRWKKIVAVIVFFLVVGVAASYLVIKPSYTSVAVLLPPKRFLGSSPMSPDLCVSILNSQTLDDKIIERLHLQSVWKRSTLSDTRTALKNEVEISETDFDAVRITVRDHDARRASDIANGFVTELNNFDTRLATSDAGYRRAFFDQEVSLRRNDLTQAETRLEDFQQQKAVINPGTQLAMILESIAALHANIADREVALQSMRRYAADSNPQVIDLTAKLAALERQLSLLEDDSRHREPGDVQIPASQLAESVLENQRVLRDVTQETTLLDFLSTQSAAARLIQVRSASPASVIDDAVITDEKSGPQRLFIWGASCWVGFTAACLYIFVRQALLRAEQASNG